MTMKETKKNVRERKRAVLKYYSVLYMICNIWPQNARVLVFCYFWRTDGVL